MKENFGKGSDDFCLLAVLKIFSMFANASFYMYVHVYKTIYIYLLLNFLALQSLNLSIYPNSDLEMLW